MREARGLQSQAVMGRIGDYVLDRELSGHEGERVFLASHAMLPRRAIVRVHTGDVRAAATQMMREAWVLEALDHSGAPRMYECGVLSGGRPWLAVEAVAGDTVASALGDGPLAFGEVLAIVRAVAEVLAHAHARGIEHGRVRAGSIVLRDGRAPCLVDWRAARIGARAGEAADVHGLGVVARHALGDQHAPRVLALVTKMLAADPARRPSAAEVAAEAARLAAPNACDDDEAAPVIEDVVLREELGRDTEPPPAARLRWTPPHGLRRLPSEGRALGRITRRS